MKSAPPKGIFKELRVDIVVDDDDDDYDDEKDVVTFNAQVTKLCIAR